MKKVATLLILWASISSLQPVLAAESLYPQLDISGYKKWE